jgi:predicted nucleic acid-binding protein
VGEAPVFRLWAFWFEWAAGAAASVVITRAATSLPCVPRFVVDCDAALHVVAEEIVVAPEHELLAPTLLRSQALSRLHEAVARGSLDAAAAADRLHRLRRLKIRLLGDAVLQKVAWEIADRLGWNETYDAEYIALTKLQADALVALDEKLARAVRQIVKTATVDDLRA